MNSITNPATCVDPMGWREHHRSPELDFSMLCYQQLHPASEAGEADGHYPNNDLADLSISGVSTRRVALTERDAFS
jgi:hypothetical protein